MIDDNLDFGWARSAASVTGRLNEFARLPPRVLVTLAIIELLSRNVTPFRLCGCGCGEPVTGKAKFAVAACRKRLERERKRLRAAGPRQINIPLQYEIPVTIPTVTSQAEKSDPTFSYSFDGGQLTAGC